MIVLKEEEKDFDEIDMLIKQAFENAEHSDNNEHNLVKNLRKSDSYISELSLVAKEDDKVIGYIMFTKAKLRDKTVLALAPLAVLPSYQNKGVGSLLIKQGHITAKKLGYEVIVVLGSEKYYPKFGYVVADEFKIIPPFEVPKENFMAINLNNEKLQYNQTLQYAKEFFE